MEGGLTASWDVLHIYTTCCQLLRCSAARQGWGPWQPASWKWEWRCLPLAALGAWACVVVCRLCADCVQIVCRLCADCVQIVSGSASGAWCEVRQQAHACVAVAAAQGIRYGRVAVHLCHKLRRHVYSSAAWLTPRAACMLA
jgi:hypothetical protein